MFRRITLLALTVIVAGAFNACLLDPETPPEPDDKPKPKGQFYDLSQEWHAVNNLVQVYEQRNLTEYDKLLDDDYIFFFSDGDFSGGQTPQEWDRSSDVTATRNMLTGANKVITANLDVPFDKDTMIWTDIIPTDPDHADETWKTTTLNYSFTFKATADLTYITVGSPRLQLTVRNNGTDSEPSWRLVQWRDLANEQ